MPSQVSGHLGRVGPCVDISEEGFLGSGCFSTNNSNVYFESFNEMGWWNSYVYMR